MSNQVVPYDPRWPAAFAAEAARLAAALGAPPVAIHHIGSTSVPGLAAKPILDILIEAEDLDRLDRAAPALAALGFEAKGEFGIPGRRYFRRDDEHGIRTHHVHGFLAGSEGAIRHLAFRDYLIAHPEEAAAYAACKQRLAPLLATQPAAYVEGKAPFVQACEQRALRWRHGR